MTCRPDVLTHLAADRALASDERDACASIWPLLAVPGDVLGTLDRDALDAHLDRCARCRAIAVEVWLDGEVAPAATVRTSALPVAVALGVLPSRRAPPRIAAWLGAVVAAAAGVAFALLPGALDRGDVAVVRPWESSAPDPDAPIALVVLVKGTEPWMGNDEYAPDDRFRHLGYHHPMARALDGLAEVMPPGSTAAVLSTSMVGTRVEWPMAPSARLRASVLGPQLQYRGRLGGVYLDESVETARQLLAQHDGRRVLLIVGDGCHVDDSVRQPFLDLGKALRRSGITVRSVLLGEADWVREVPCGDTVRALGDPAPRRTEDGAHLPALLRAVIEDLRRER